MATDPTSMMSISAPRQSLPGHDRATDAAACSRTLDPRDLPGPSDREGMLARVAQFFDGLRRRHGRSIPLGVSLYARGSSISPPPHPSWIRDIDIVLILSSPAELREAVRELTAVHALSPELPPLDVSALHAGRLSESGYGVEAKYLLAQASLHLAGPDYVLHTWTDRSAYPLLTQRYRASIIRACSALCRAGGPLDDIGSLEKRVLRFGALATIAESGTLLRDPFECRDYIARTRPGLTPLASEILDAYIRGSDAGVSARLDRLMRLFAALTAQIHRPA